MRTAGSLQVAGAARRGSAAAADGRFCACVGLEAGRGGPQPPDGGGDVARQTGALRPYENG